MGRVETIAEFAKKMAELPYSTGEMHAILLKSEDRCYMTDDYTDFRNVQPEDILDVTELDLPEKDALMRLSSRRAMVLFRTPYVGVCLDAKHTIDASLDDMAQIVGRQVQIVPRAAGKLRAALRSAEAVLVEDRYAIAVGRSLYEAYTAMTVLEKQAEVMLKASVIGGAKPLGRLECQLMHTVYMQKYSKAEKEHRDESEG